MSQVIDVYQFIYNLAFNMLNCHHLSLDIAQQIFLQYSKKLENHPEMDENYKKYWIIRSTKNKCLNYIRNNKKILFLNPTDIVESIDNSLNPYEVLEHNENKQNLYAKLKKHMNSLPDNQKYVLNLRFEKDLSHEQIMKITGYGLSKVKCLIHRAVKTLKNKMC